MQKWFVINDVPGENIGYRAIVDESGYTVCNPSPMGSGTARLIAAAPEMLDLLYVILMQHRTDGAYSSQGGVALSSAMEGNIERMIAKARGES